MASPSPAASAPTQTVLVQLPEAYPDQGIVHNIPDANEEVSVIFAEHRYMKPALQSEPTVKQNRRRAADTTPAADDQEDTASKRSRRPSTSSICTNQSACSELRTDNIMDTGNSRAEEETNDAEHPINWQTVVYGRRKKQEASRNLSSFLEAAAANPQLKQKKDSFNVVYRSKEPYDLAGIPAAVVERNFYPKLGLNPKTCTPSQRPSIRSNKAANTISVKVYDRKLVAPLLAITSIRAPDKTVEVVAHETMLENTCRGVVHETDPTESPQELIETIVCRTHEVLHARPLGSRGLALVTFSGTRPPRQVLYHGMVKRVTLYIPMTMVCRRCQGLGHKENVCTRKARCQDCGCITLERHVCERKYCANCRSSAHIATDPNCPARLKANKLLQAKAIGMKSNGSQGTGGKGGATAESRPPEVTITEYPELPNSTPGRGRSRSASRASQQPSARETSRSLSHKPKKVSHNRSTSVHRRSSSRRPGDYAHALHHRNKKGYHRDENDELKSWQEEIRAIEAEAKSGKSMILQLEAELAKYKRKEEEDNKKREARKAVITKRIQETMEARKAAREKKEQERDTSRQEIVCSVPTTEEEPQPQLTPTQNASPSDWETVLRQIQLMQQQMRETQQFQQFVMQKLGMNTTLPQHAH